MAYVQALRCRECGREYDIAPDLHLRVVLRPARGGLRLRRDRGRPSAARRSPPARSRSGATPICCRPSATPRSISVPASRRWCAPTGSPPSSGSARCGSRTTRVNPTNSFKDRVTSVALSKALEFGFKIAACASTGNLANSVAAHAAHAGLRSFVFIPANLEQGKIVTTAVYGGNVVAIDGNYDDVNRLCAELAGTYPWAFVNVNVRTYYAEGSKTLAFETAEQLGWQTPDHVVVPGRERLAAHQDPQGLRRAAQGRAARRGAEGAGVGCAGARAARRSRTAWLDGADNIKPVKPDTIAKSLAIGNPADGYFALDAVRQTGGGLRGGHRRRDRRRDAAARPDRGDLRRDRRWRDHRDAEAARRRRASCGPTSASSPTSPATG